MSEEGSARWLVRGQRTVRVNIFQVRCGKQEEEEEEEEEEKAAPGKRGRRECSSRE